MMKAPQRTARRAPGKVRLMPRELCALVFIAEAQPITTGAFQRFLGVSIAVARRSLRKLRDLSLVKVHVLALELPSRYTITAAGQRLVAEAQGCRPERFRVPRGIGKLALAHHDGSVDLFVALKAAAAEQSDVRLQEFYFEETLRKEVGEKRGVQIPDAVAIVTDGAGSRRLALAIEIDQGTEAPSFVAKRKGVPYSMLRANGLPLKGCSDWCVLCVTVSEARRNRLISALWEADVMEGLWFYTTRQAMDAGNVLSSAWVTPRLHAGGERAELVVESPLQGVITGYDDGRHSRPPRSP